MLTDTACSYHVHRYLDQLPGAERELEDLIADTPTTDLACELAALTRLVAVEAS